MISSSNLICVERFPPEPLLSTVIYIIENQLRKGSTESWTRVFGLKVQGANHYTIQPTQNLKMLTLVELPLLMAFHSLFVMIFVWLLFGFSLVFVHWSVSFLTSCVNSNLHQWSKVIEKRILARFELGFLNSEFKLLASNPQNLLGIKGSLCCVSCVCWCLFWSWPIFFVKCFSLEFFFSLTGFLLSHFCQM